MVDTGVAWEQRGCSEGKTRVCCPRVTWEEREQGNATYSEASIRSS